MSEPEITIPVTKTSPFWRCSCGCIVIPLGGDPPSGSAGVNVILIEACDSVDAPYERFSESHALANKILQGRRLGEAEHDRLVRRLGELVHLGVLACRRAALDAAAARAVAALDKTSH